MWHEMRRVAIAKGETTTARSFEGRSHTMRSENFLKYLGRHGLQDGDNQILGKKFTLEQIRVLQKAYQEHTQIRVLGLYDPDAVGLAKERKLSLTGAPHSNNRQKISNRHRPTFLELRRRSSKHCELWIVVFPSRQYVDQVAELVQAILDDFKRGHVRAADPHKGLQQVTTEHFPELEKSVTEWTGFRSGLPAFIRSGDVVAIGQVELLADGLADLGFVKKFVDWRSFGLDQMFSAQIYVHGTSLSRIVLIAIHHCFWGQASAYFAHACSESGAAHLLYASKAGTLTQKKSVGAIHSPQDFLLCDGYDHDTTVESLSSRMKLEPELKRLAQTYGITATGYAVTVPTVVSETLDQRNKLTQWNPSTIDNEDAHIAKILANFHENLVSKARFVPVHYITDYIHRPNEKPKKNQQHLGETRVAERNKKFRSIGRFFAHYALIHGIRDYVRISTETVGARAVKGERGVMEILTTRQHLLDNGLVREALYSMIGLTEKPELDAAKLSAIALTCQKYGFVDDAMLALDLLHAPNFAMQGEDKFRMESVKVKLLSQCGQFQQALDTAKTLMIEMGQLPAEGAPFLNALSYRAAVAAANTARHDEAKTFLREAQQRVALAGADKHSYATHRAFTAICSIAYENQASELMVLAQSLSEARGQYLAAVTDHSVWRVNPEKSFLSALFTESALFLIYGSEDDQRGWDRLIAAHLFNIRIGGTERSEGFAELIHSVRPARVKEALRLAMRMDGPGRVSFQKIPAVSRRVEKVQKCLQIQKLPLIERNDKLNEILLDLATT